MANRFWQALLRTAVASGSSVSQQNNLKADWTWQNFLYQSPLQIVLTLDALENGEHGPPKIHGGCISAKHHHTERQHSCCWASSKIQDVRSNILTVPLSFMLSGPCAAKVGNCRLDSAADVNLDIVSPCVPATASYACICSFTKLWRLQAPMHCPGE